MSKAVERMKVEGFYVQNVDKDRGDFFRFDIPKELSWVGMICPEAFVAYFPEWLKAEFAKRTNEEIRITSLSFSGKVDKFLNGDSYSYGIEGKYIVI